ncbi:TPA: carbon storage regulator [Legionella pneumophila]|uniref:carbon storage regulator n=1 Tax=Legionella pneumophila TaxID=446 RepID=UPI0007707645|nr:carbon storage regulator [Legionella pneumophila]CZP77308.1 Carbon storage regulator homolog [Legionella pneumophila]CZQ07318.1 Carbon storage regulator homolog [Legionella pneumophila]HAU0792879.1 carbon storage regulator [Legionella pneumophila]HDV5821449.1 carbon storage regulator [Legionella pneumophila]
MLVLTRKLGERIVMDDGKIEIVYLSRRGNNVALGIQAPPHIDVNRKEIFISKQQDKKDKTELVESED